MKAEEETAVTGTVAATAVMGTIVETEERNDDVSLAYRRR